MSTIAITRTHTASRKEARELINRVAQDFNERMGVECQWEGSDLTFRHAGVYGNIHVGEAEVTGEVTLNLMLRPMKGLIEEKIRRYLRELPG